MVPSSFDPPTEAKSGTDIFPTLDNRLGEKREDQVYALAAAGNFPAFLRQWIELPVSCDSIKGTVYVMPDYFCVGTDEDYLYTPMGAINAERIGVLFNARLPTAKLVQLMYDKSCAQVAQPWGPPYDASMSRTERWLQQTTKVRIAMRMTGAKPGELVEGHCKSIITSKKTMDGKGQMLGFWGWFKADGKPIQGDSQAHGAGYCDYAHGAHYVMNEMVVEGEIMDMGEVLRHRDFYRLISDKRFGEHTTYHDVRKANGITTLLY